MITALISITIYGFLAHYISYTLEKNRLLRKQRWDLNICCGKTDGGGVNADIVKHLELPHFRLVDDIYNLPFSEKEFESVLCSHTLEHVDDPEGFYNELSRVGTQVTVVIPPLYDIFAALNIFEHKVIFLSFKKSHHTLPPYIRLPFAHSVHQKIGQLNRA